MYLLFDIDIIMLNEIEVFFLFGVIIIDINDVKKVGNIIL